MIVVYTIRMRTIEESQKLVIARLKHMREERKLSQMDLARAAGISQNMITYIETGKRTPTLSTLLKLCDALNINPSVLFTEENDAHKDAKREVLNLIERYF